MSLTPSGSRLAGKGEYSVLVRDQEDGNRSVVVIDNTGHDPWITWQLWGQGMVLVGHAELRHT